MTLTYSPDKDTVESRRGAQCPNGFCKPEYDALVAATKVKFKGGGAMSCDEAPWASSEEGGDWLDFKNRAQTCVPSFMNSAWGGNCQSKFWLFFLLFLFFFLFLSSQLEDGTDHHGAHTLTTCSLRRRHRNGQPAFNELGQTRPDHTKRQEE